MGTPGSSSAATPEGVPAERPKFITTERAAGIMVIGAVLWLTGIRKAFAPVLANR